MAGLRLAWNVGSNNAGDPQAVTLYSQVSGYAQISIRAATRVGTTPTFFVDYSTAQLGTTPSLIYYACYRNTSPFDLMESGEFYFDGAQIIKTPELYTVLTSLQTALEAHVTAEHTATKSDVASNISALNDVSSTDITTIVNSARDSVNTNVDSLNDVSSANITTIVNAARDSVNTNIDSLNDLSAADVKAQVDLSLADYDPPTAAELTATQTAVLSGINSGNATINTNIAALNNVSVGEVRNEVDASIAAYDAPTNAEMNSKFATTDSLITGERVAVESAIAAAQTAINSNTDTGLGALNDPSVAEIEAALIDDDDGSTFKAALALTIENAILNDTDGAAVLAGMQGATAAALTAYGVSTASDVSASTSAVQGTIGALSFATPTNVTDARDLIQADIANIETVDISSLATGAQISSAQANIRGDITALNNLSATDVANSLFTYGTATVASVNTARDVVTNAVAGLNDLSLAQVQTELSSLNVAEKSDVTSILNAITSSSVDITATETNTLDIKQLLRADQVPVGNDIVYYREGSNKTVELHRQTITGGVSVLSGLGLES